jgi:hypothetical protein
MILECQAAKDQAALISILFHTKKIKDEFGSPPSYLAPPAAGGGTTAKSAVAGGLGSQPSALSDSIISQLAGVSGTNRDAGSTKEGGKA